jgi:alpha-tubulin suppressor-like RCC1 family protein
MTTVEKFKRIQFQFNGNIKKIAAGARHCLVLLDNGELYAFGDNSEGQCTGFSTRYSFPVKVDIESREKIVDVYSGYSHNLIILSKYNLLNTGNGEMFTWGDTSSGKLGYFEGNLTQTVPRIIQGLKGKYANNVSLGFQMTVISTSSFENSLVNISNINN